MRSFNPTPPPSGEKLRPLVDDAIHELDERDREAVLLRFFENRPFAEIGATLRLSEDAARMRVDRAIDKLRSGFARRGVTSTSGALAAAFANQVGAIAPAGLAGTITSAAVAGGVGGIVGATFLMTKTTTTVVVSVFAILALGLIFRERNRAAQAGTELAALTADRASLRIRLRDEQRRADSALNDLAARRREGELPTAKPSAVVPTMAAALPPAQIVIQQQKAILNNLRYISAAVDQFNLQNNRLPASIDELVGEGNYIKQLVPVDGENYAGLPMLPGGPLVTTTAGGLTVVYAGSNSPNTTQPEPKAAVLRVDELGRRIAPAFKRAEEAYRATHNGKFPPYEALIPFFSTPQEGADFVEYLEAVKALRGK